MVYLRKNTSQYDSIVVLPEGVGINFFFHRENPTDYYTFILAICKLIGEKK